MNERGSKEMRGGRKVLSETGKKMDERRKVLNDGGRKELRGGVRRKV